MNENAGSVALTVTRSGGSDGAGSVNYVTQDGTASADVDYTAASGTLAWSDGDSASKTITVTVINRSGKQDNRAFDIRTSCLMGGPGYRFVSADFDGDGIADPAVYHQDNGLWEVFLSAHNYQELSGRFGGPAYQPVTE